MEQILVNLLVNSRDAMPQGGRIDVRTANVQVTPSNRRGGLAPGRYVELTVRDHGQGMSAEVRQRVFEPFFTTKSRGRGTGLGLSTVFGIVKQAGGEIEVESEPGEGTTFHVLLPVVEAQDAAPVGEQAPAEEIRGNETVLVAQDDEAVRGLPAELLAALGYTVLTASNGAAAARLVRDRGETIDLLLTDMVMPGQTGKDLAEEIRGTRPGLPVVFLSGYTDESLPVDAAVPAFFQGSSVGG